MWFIAGSSESAYLSILELHRLFKEDNGDNLIQVLCSLGSCIPMIWLAVEQL